MMHALTWQSPAGRPHRMFTTDWNDKMIGAQELYPEITGFVTLTLVNMTLGGRKYYKNIPDHLTSTGAVRQSY